MSLKNATGYHTDAKCCHAGAKRLDCAGLRFSLHHGRLMRNAHLLCVQNRVSTLKTVSTMEVLIFQKEAFEEMAAKFSRFSDRVNELLAKQGGKSLNRWMDNQEVCRQLNISPRTLQTLRDNGTLAYSQINHKVFYRPEDVSRIVKPVERKLADKAV